MSKLKTIERKKVCIFCQDKVDGIDYKDVAKLRRELARWHFSPTFPTNSDFKDK